jgi:hypothetical protein
MTHQPITDRTHTADEGRVFTDRTRTVAGSGTPWRAGTTNPLPSGINIGPLAIVASDLLVVALFRYPATIDDSAAARSWMPSARHV